MTTEQKPFYEFSAERDGRQWRVRLHGPGGVDVVPPFRSRTIERLHEKGLELVAAHLRIDPELVEQEVEFQSSIGGVPEDAQDDQFLAFDLTTLARNAALRAHEAHVRAVSGMAQAGFTIRDIAALVELSPTRVHQLLAEADSPKEDEEEENSPWKPDEEAVRRALAELGVPS